MISAGRFERNSANKSENLNGMSGKVIYVTQGDPDRVKVITYWEVSYSIVIACVIVYIYTRSDEGNYL